MRCWCRRRCLFYRNSFYESIIVFEGFLVVVKVEFVGVKIFVFCVFKMTGKGVVVVDSLMVVVGAVLMRFVCL